MANTTPPILPMSHVTRNYKDHLVAAQSSEENRAMPLPLDLLSQTLGGLRTGELTFLGGYEGHGKSVLANQIALYLGEYFKQDKDEDRKRKVLIFTGEMDHIQLMNRWITSKYDMPLEKLVNPETLVEKDWETIEEALAYFYTLQINIIDTPGVGIYDLQDSIRKANQDGVVKLLVVDYFQLLSDVDTNNSTSVDKAGQNLKELARQTKTHVIAISNLNRNGAQFGGLPEPNSTNLRASQGLANSADNILFVHNFEFVDPEVDNEWRGGCLFKVEKQRNGPKGRYRLDWNGDQVRFEDPTGARLSNSLIYKKKASYGVNY